MHASGRACGGRATGFARMRGDGRTVRAAPTRVKFPAPALAAGHGPPAAKRLAGAAAGAIVLAADLHAELAKWAERRDGEERAAA